MAKVNGTEMTVYTGSDVILYTTSCTLNLEQDTPDTTNKGSGGYEEHIGGVRRWSIDFDGLFDLTGTGYTAVEIFDNIVARTADTTVKFGTSAAAATGYTGSATFTNVTIVADAENAVTFSGSLKGNGAIAAI